MKITLLDKYPRSLGHPIQDFVAFNKKQRDQYIKDYLEISDLYISVYAFAEVSEDRRKTISSSAIIDKVFFDFDDEDTWLEDLLKVHKWCKERNIIHRCHCSGRGGHVFIFINPNIINKKSTLSNFQHYIVEKLNVNLDKQIIGDVARIFRYPNTVNFKAVYEDVNGEEQRRYCVVLPNELLNEPNIDIEMVYDFSKQQRYINPYTNEELNGFIGDKLLDISHFDDGEFHYNDFTIENIDLDDINEDISIEFGNFPLCIQSMLSTKEPASKVKYILNKYLQKQDKTDIPLFEDDIIAIDKRVWSKDEFNHYFKGKYMRGHYGHHGKKFISTLNNNYELPSCKTMKEMGLCKFSDKECNRKHPLHD